MDKSPNKSFKIFIISMSLIIQFELLQSGQINTIIFRKFHHWFISLSDDKNVIHSCGKTSSMRILNMDNIKSTQVTFSVSNNSNSSNIMSSDDVTAVSLENHLNMKNLPELNGITSTISPFSRSYLIVS